MSNEQILKKAIKKAVKNGFPKEEYRLLKDIYGMNFLTASIGVQLDRPQYYSIIFSHDFAKAFWGEKMVGDNLYGVNPKLLDYLFHLQQMVLEKDPIKYLEKFI